MYMACTMGSFAATTCLTNVTASSNFSRSASASPSVSARNSCSTGPTLSSALKAVAGVGRVDIVPLRLNQGLQGGELRAGRQAQGRQTCAAVASDAPTTGDPIETGIPTESASVILLAGGMGKRMGANMPKQYLPLLGQPIALHSFYTFANMPEVQEIIVVCDPSYRDIFEDAGKSISIPLKFALPGKERQDSVRSGLQEISKFAKLACVHDSARPLVLPEDIRKVIKDAAVHGAAVLGVPVKATIKEAGSDCFVTKTLDRCMLWEMQTPQVIEPSLLARGFELVEREGLQVTDDVSIVEYLKHPVFITQGSYTNLKVTTPDDLYVAERIIHQKAPTATSLAL